MFKFKQVTLVLCEATLALSLLNVANASPLDRYYLHKMQKEEARSSRQATVQTQYYNQLIDHADPQKGTFKQRFYVDESYAADANSPVFFYICGESTCYASALGGEMRAMAKQYHAKMVALEHRYYGKSLPTKTLSSQDLRFLSTDAALKDLARFQKYMMSERNWHGKWVSFGGSYPGSLSAYYRLSYPELVVGALASSAPVEARENFEDYDAHVTKVSGTTCATLMRKGTRQLETALANPDAMRSLKQRFQVEGLKDNTDFLFFVADIGAAAVQYGYKDMFCSMLEKSDDVMDGWANFARFFYGAWGIDDPISLAIQGAESEDPADYSDGLGMRQWFYQSCREYGYWQTANQDKTKSTRSQLINMDYYHNVCKRLFDISEHAETKRMNEAFYKPLQTSDIGQIFFTNGSEDPWSRLSLSMENGNASNPLLTYYTIEGSAHCADLHTPRASDSDALRSARSQLSDLLSKWLT